MNSVFNLSAFRVRFAPRNDRATGKDLPIPRKNKNLRHRLFLARQDARLGAVSRKARAELAQSRQRLSLRSKARRKAMLARMEARQKPSQATSQLSGPQDGLGPEERMRRISLRESLSVRVSSFLLFLKNDPPDPEKEPAQIALWNDYIEGLNLGAGDIARYREAPPEKEALVERLFSAGVGEEA